MTGQTNDDGTYRVVFKKQGSPAQQVDISSDDVLLPADVLRDLISLGCDLDFRCPWRKKMGTGGGRI